MIDEEAIKKHVRGIITALGENPDREGLLETPERVAHMYKEVFEGINYTNREIADMFGKTFTSPSGSGSDMVVVKDIDAFSFCEHHMALMYDMKITVAYIPCGRVIGLSKIVRISEMVTKRLQLQERIGTDIAEIIMMATGSSDVAVIIEACHSCMTARGIKNSQSKTKSSHLYGRFESEPQLFERVLNS